MDVYIRHTIDRIIKKLKKRVVIQSVDLDIPMISSQ